MGIQLATRRAIASTYSQTNNSITSRSQHPSSAAATPAPVAAMSSYQSPFSQPFTTPFYDTTLPFPSAPTSPPTTLPSAFIEAITTPAPIATPVPVQALTVAATLPSATQTFALGNGSDMEEENLSDVSMTPSPLSVPHLCWKANVVGHNDFPVPVDCLLDCGAHLVLIRPETVVDLCLPVQKLKDPLTVSLALNGKDTITTLYDCVTFSVSSLNNAWSSRSVTAIITPGLCTNILLGLPFLAHNKIVIDAAARSAIHKPSGFDLLNEDAVRLKNHAPKSTPWER